MYKNLESKIKSRQFTGVRRLPQPAGCGGKHDFSNGVQCGRSMIEMMGVLAIIAVLSVGGIAGYSKAMEKWKTNRAIEDYSLLIHGLLEHIDEIHKMPNPSSVGLTYLADSLNLIPNNWAIINAGAMQDAYGNTISLAVYPAAGDMPARISFDLLLGGIQTSDSGSLSPAFSVRLCRTLFTDLIRPINSSIWATAVNKKTSGWENYYSNSWCGQGRKCLEDLTVTQIDKLCRSCDGNQEACSVNISF